MTNKTGAYRFIAYDVNAKIIDIIEVLAHRRNMWKARDIKRCLYQNSGAIYVKRFRVPYSDTIPWKGMKNDSHRTQRNS